MTTLEAPPLLHSPPRPFAARYLTLPNLLTLAFLLLCGTFTFTHPLWRDEAQAFLIARDSHSLGQLLYNLRYEGHPPLWHFLLFLVTRITPRPEAMQALHLVMAATSVYLVARFSPFPWPIKILFAFGYFPFFEYAVFARNYQLFMLLTLALCALWQHRRYSFLLTGLLLAALCLTHVFGDILAAGLGAVFFLDALLTKTGRAAIRAHPLRFAIAITLAIAAAAASVKLLIPPPDSSYKPAWHLQWEPARVQKALATLWSAYIPVPKWTKDFWNTHALLPSPVDQARWGVILAAVALAFMVRSWRAMLFFLITTGGTLVFFYIKLNSGAIRHHGVLFVILIAAFWIAWIPRIPSARRPSPAGDVGPSRFRRLVRSTLHLFPRLALAFLLTLHVYAAIIACNECWTHPFTHSKEAAAAISAALRPGDILVSGNQIITPSVAAYLPGRMFYFPNGNRWGTFTLWDNTDWRDATTDEILDFAQKQTRPLLIIRCWNDDPLPGATRLAHIDNGLEGLEMYTLYRLEPRRRSRR